MGAALDYWLVLVVSWTAFALIVGLVIAVQEWWDGRR